MNITMTPINSSQVLGAYYDAATQDLHVEFPKSGVYVYQGVPADVGQGLFVAESAGKYLHAAIRPFYGGLRPDGTAFDPTPAKAPKAAKPVPTMTVTAEVAGPPIEQSFLPPTTAPAAKSETVPVQADEPYPWDAFVADMEAAGSEFANLFPQSIVGMGDLNLFSRLVDAADRVLAFEAEEYQRRIRNTLRRREALTRYYGPLAERFTRELVPALGGRKSIDASAHRFSLTTQPARLQLDDQDKALAWAKVHKPEAVTTIPAHTVPATTVPEQVLFNPAPVVEAWKEASKDKPAPAPDGFTLVPESQKFSYKPLTAAKEA